MRKTLLNTLSATVLVASLSACATQDDTSSDGPPASVETGANADEPAGSSTDAPESEDPTSEPEEASSVSEEPATDGPAASEPEISPRGTLVKEIGEIAGLRDNNGNDIMTFTLTRIEPDYTCTSPFAEPSLNGNFIALTFDVQTTPALADWINNGGMPPDFNPHYFRVIDVDGTRENDSVGNGIYCPSDSELLPATIGPAETISGKIVLDSKYSEGIIIYSPPADGLGWEWVF